MFRVGKGEFGVRNGEWGMGNGEWGVRSSEFGVRGSEFEMGNGEFGVRNAGVLVVLTGEKRKRILVSVRITAIGESQLDRSIFGA